MGILQTVTQPDGTSLEVKVFGDEFYNWHESLDGYTMIQDPNIGVWCYATLNADASELISSGIPYSQTENASNKARVSSTSPFEKGIRLSAARIHEKVKIRKETLNEQSSSLMPATKNATSFIQQKTSSDSVEHIEMMTILIDFPDQSSTLSVSEVENLFNQENYKQYGNNGSIKDFYKDVSQGKLHLETKVSPYYYRAPNPKGYYAANNHANLHQLIKDALIDLDNNGYDFSSLSTDSKGVRALNVLYAGESRHKGALWPHKWRMPIVTLDGVTFSRYQISGTGSSKKKSVNIGVIAHELGHLLFNWPDTYDYGYDSSGVGIYDLMAEGSSFNPKNPTPPNPYFRNVLAGWGTITELKPGNTDQSISISSASYDAHAYQTPRKNELFMLENIQNTKSRYTLLPGSGLLVWHIDTNVVGNNDQDMTESSHYQVSVEQADGAFDLENYNNYGDPFDFFHSRNNASFGANTTPSSKMWNDKSSGLEITNISLPGRNMTFTLKANSDADQTPPVLTQSNPLNKKKNFDKTSPITLTFNETIQLGPQFNKVKLIELSTKKIISMTPTLSNNQLTFRPTTSLRPKTVYLLQIPKNMIQDTSGNGNKGFKIKFQTKK